PASSPRSLHDALPIYITAVMSHLACGDQPDHPMNAAQRARLLQLRALLPSAAGKAPLSLANSAGVFLGPAYHFDIVRPGIALFRSEEHTSELQSRENL